MVRVHLDYNAITPIGPKVVSDPFPLLTSDYGNPLSSHWAGEPARPALGSARLDVPALLGASPEEIIFHKRG